MQSTGVNLMLTAAREPGGQGWAHQSHEAALALGPRVQNGAPGEMSGDRVHTDGAWGAGP